jgi:hypothetical protein
MKVMEREVLSMQQVFVVLPLIYATNVSISSNTPASGIPTPIIIATQPLLPVGTLTDSILGGLGLFPARS